jgi:ArsR family transcriptional regulator
MANNMDAAIELRCRQKVLVLKALAHPSRLAIFETLAEGERCVCDLQKLVQSDLSTVSKHLALMKRAGVVTDRREGARIFYRLRIPCLLRFTDCIETVVLRGAIAANEKPDHIGCSAK